LVLAALNEGPTPINGRPMMPPPMQRRNVQCGRWAARRRENRVDVPSRPLATLGDGTRRPLPDQLCTLWMTVVDWGSRPFLAGNAGKTFPRRAA
jgi:hypothetical protein